MLRISAWFTCIIHAAAFSFIPLYWNHPPETFLVLSPLSSQAAPQIQLLQMFFCFLDWRHPEKAKEIAESPKKKDLRGSEEQGVDGFGSWGILESREGWGRDKDKTIKKQGGTVKNT